MLKKYKIGLIAWLIQFFFVHLQKILMNMLTKIETLKLIKEKVDSRASGKVKLKKRVETEMQVGVFKHTEKRTFKELFKRGNSVFCIDTNYEVHNINELDGKALRTMMWQLITDKEKRDIALDHLYSTMDYLKD